MSARRLAALVRYLLVNLVNGQRALVPVIVFVLIAGVLLSGDHLAAPGPWPATALSLYAVAAWIGLVAANAEDPSARSVTVASVGGPAAVTAATALVALLLSSTLAVLVVTAPGVISPSGFPPSALLAGVLAHLCSAVAGTGIGLVTARPLISRVGWSFVVAALVVVMTGVQPWLPPVGAAVRALNDVPLSVSPLGIDLVVAFGFLAVAATASWAAAKRG